MCDPISDSQKISPLLQFSKLSNLNLTVISFEKKSDFNSKRIKFLTKKLEKANIDWIKLPFYKNILFRTIIFLYFEILVFFILLSKKIKIIHAWSYIPMLLIIVPNFFLNLKVIFDIRGFWFDEKKDFSQINFFIYFILKKIEKILYKSAYKIITLSKQSIKIIESKFDIDKKNILFVTTFADKNNFKIINFKKINKFKFLYLGSAKNSYDFNKVINFLNIFDKYFKRWSLTAYSKDKNYIRKLISTSNLRKSNFKVSAISVNKIKKALYKYNFGIYFIKPTFAKKASCPTKLAELMLSGIPVITNYGIGDINYFERKGNIILFKFDKINEFSFKHNLKKILSLKKNLRTNKQRKFAEKIFDEKLYFKKILSIYNRI